MATWSLSLNRQAPVAATPEIDEAVARGARERLDLAGTSILADRPMICSVRCGYRLPDGLTCFGPAFILDARRGRMLCRQHAVMPLERRFGPRADLEQKAEFALRFLALPSANRHDILEALDSEERREFMQIALTFATDD